MTVKASCKNVTVAMDGVGGTISMPLGLRLAMRMARADHTVRVFFWTHGIWQPIKDLTDRGHIESKSLELQSLLESLIAEGCNVSIVAKSGGSIVAVKALERLPEAAIANVVLLSPAISPNYDLSIALRAVGGGLHSFYSRHDRLYLDLGTSLFGTSDGIKGPSAGCVGFVSPAPDSSDPEQYAKLKQVPWHPSMLSRLHIGLHLGNSMIPWLLKYVVPVLHQESASELSERI